MNCVIHKNGLDIPSAELSSPYSIPIVLRGLCLSDSKHLSATCGTNALCRRLTILHSYGLSIFHFPFGTALKAVCLHQSTSFLTIMKQSS
jgi:hypothetical protein